MAEAMRDGLVPSLLDRLTDNDPEGKAETRECGLLSITQLRAVVLRDLGWLFNTIHLDINGNLDPYPEIRHSVLNYGLPAISGHCVSGTDMPELERQLRRAIINFEPRLIADSVTVRAKTNADALNHHHHNIISFEISAQLWAQPAPVELTIQTDIDLENGQCHIA